MSFDSWKLRAPEDEHSDGDGPEPDGVTCCECGHFMADDDSDKDAFAHNGAWYCEDCHCDVLVDELDAVSAADIARDDR